MRVVPCTFVLACLLIGSTGCQLFEKKNSGGDGPFLGAKSNDAPKVAPPSDPLIGNGGELEGLLAGRVIDGSGRPADAQIRWVCMDDAKGEETPLEVAVNGQGYFMIQGLKSGKRYKLTTRAKSGEKTVEVVTLTQAPNVHLLISVSEKFAKPSAPEKGKSDKGKKSGSGGKEQPASAQIPIPLPGWPQPDPPMLPQVGAFGDKTKIADKGDPLKAPTVITPGPGGNGWQIPGPGPGPAVHITPPVPSPYSVPFGPPPIPSSAKVGLRLENFALYDVSLQPWELKTRRRGNLVLLDFWKTNCVPCLQSILPLKILQDKYGQHGLEVVGIAYEDTGTLMEQSRRVSAVALGRQANYQLLLGAGKTCPLKRDLEVRLYPTMVLLDESGATVWRHEGVLDGPTLADLEFAVKRRLTPQPY